MKRVIWKNSELLESICFDKAGNALNQYNPVYDTQPDAEIMILENGYGYIRLPGEENFQEGYCMRDQNFADYVDNLHVAFE